MADKDIFNKMKKDIISIILNAIIIVLGIIVIYMIILKIIGRSPTTDQIMIGLMSIMATGIFNMYYKQGYFESKLDSIAGRLDNFSRQFQALANDFKAHIKTAKK